MACLSLSVGSITMKRWSASSIVIGSCLDSMVFCEQREAVLLAVDPIAPQFFETDHAEWHEKMFSLSVNGQVPFHDSIQSIRI